MKVVESKSSKCNNQIKWIKAEKNRETEVSKLKKIIQ